MNVPTSLPPVATADRPFGLPAESFEFSIDLPCPPSVNRTRKIDPAGRGLIRDFYRQADMLVLAQRGRTRAPLPIRKITGRFDAHILISEKLTSIDLDNGIKSIIDYAVRIELVPDDNPKFLRRLVVEWGAAIEGCRLTLRSIA